MILLNLFKEVEHTIPIMNTTPTLFKIPIARQLPISHEVSFPSVTPAIGGMPPVALVAPRAPVETATQVPPTASEILAQQSQTPSTGLAETPLKVCIIGAGISGLYSAMILDSLGMDYDIIESNTRVGGRIYTHRFNGAAGAIAPVGDPARYDYFDVGAMRYPRIPWMDRVFDLFSALHLPLVPYTISHPKTRMYFNGQRWYTEQASVQEDPFGFSQAEGDRVPTQFFSGREGAACLLIEDCYDPFKAQFGEVYAKNPPQRPAAFRDAWARLTAHDYDSTRSHMRSAPHLYPESVIDWLEMVDSATGLYDKRFVENVLASQLVAYLSA
ncbi:hypothetical protein RhiJN_24304 [Ceratobasidium sp. AG-Ba]|nr:hypothetical protein RhiJN_24304 [Ceratobasidium sp. AG-Ba]